MGTKVDTKGAAAITGWSVKTLENKRSTGGGPPFLKLGSRVVYDVDVLNTWLATCERTSTSDPGPQPEAA